MLNKQALTRYRIIDWTINNIEFPTFARIHWQLKQAGFSISHSMLQKDMNAMRFDKGLKYFAPIEYDERKSGYYYSDEEYTIDVSELTKKIKELKDKLNEKEL